MISYKHTNKQTNRVQQWLQVHILRALGASSLCLPVIVAGAELLVSICSWRHAQALGAAFLAEEHARFLVCCFRASRRATGRTILRMKAAFSDTMHGKAV